MEQFRYQFGLILSSVAAMSKEYRLEVSDMSDAKYSH